jgi:hypothetical protein
MSKNNRLNKNRKNGKTPFLLPEYYIFPFQWLHSKYLEDAENIVKEARKKIKRDYASSVKDGAVRIIAGDDAHLFLKGFLETVEDAMARFLRAHSPYFWLHLYRRIGIGSIASEGEKADSSVLSSVRLTMETAILKYGDLGIHDDMCASDELDAKAVLDGLLYEVCGAAGKTSAQIEQIWKMYKKQWVLKNYRREDHTIVYMLEGYAYEYWRATANMRAIGKGAALVISADGGWSEVRSKALDRLILSYDRRIAAGQTYLSTAKGLLSFDRKEKADEKLVASNLLYATYNVDRISFREIVDDDSLGDVVGNFVPITLHYERFLEAHQLLSKPFFKKWKFSLSNVLLFFWAVSFYVMLSRRSEEAPDIISVFHLLQRAYAQINITFDELVLEFKKAVDLLSIPRALAENCSLEELSRISHHFYLSPESQEKMSLWSLGPRPVIIPFRDTQIIDIGGMQGILTNLFFGVREPQQERGIEFERILREEALHRGYNLLPDRILRVSDIQYREADLVVRINNTLILCDCRSIERPLDWVIGKPSTIDHRNSLINKKVHQVLSLRSFVDENPVGRNYDYSWADEVYSIGVLPDIEWIPSGENEYWIEKDEDLPVLMSVQEMFNLFAKISGKSRQGGNVDN